MTKRSVREALRLAIADWDHGLGDAVADDTPLISSGRLDSFNLLRLLLWVESEIGHPVDATQIDLASEWDTVDRIVGFVERNQTPSEH
jgi:acyl carrier protein